MPVTYDNLLAGWQGAAKFGLFEQGDLTDRARLDEVLAKYGPKAVRGALCGTQLSGRSGGIARKILTQQCFGVSDAAKGSRGRPGV